MYYTTPNTETDLAAYRYGLGIATAARRQGANNDEVYKIVFECVGEVFPAADNEHIAQQVEEETDPDQ
jgi:hypothetical protein